MKTRSKMSRAYLMAMTWLWVLGLLVVALTFTPAQAQPCGEPRPRAMWIYSDPDVVGDETARNELFAFVCNYPTSELFLQVRYNQLPDLSYQTNLRIFLQQAHAAGIRVHALFGENHWALSENHHRAVARAEAIISFNNESAFADEKFDGLHLDVEPHLLPAYQQEESANGDSPDPDKWMVRLDILRQFLDMNRTVVEAIDGQMSYGVDIPIRWHPNVNNPRPALANMQYDGSENYPTYHLMDKVKDVTMMAYTNNGDRIIRWTEKAVEYAASPEVNARVYVGVQTAPPCVTRPPPNQDKCDRDSPTYHPDQRPPNETLGHLTRSEMEDVLRDIDLVLSGYPSFQGFSYYKYKTYRDMAE